MSVLWRDGGESDQPIQVNIIGQVATDKFGAVRVLHVLIRPYVRRSIWCFVGTTVVQVPLHSRRAADETGADSIGKLSIG